MEQIGDMMNKSALIEHIAKQADLTKVAAADALKAFMTGVTKALAKGDDVPLVGFGTFKVSPRKARTGRNPQTGAVIQIKASKVVRFVAGKSLKESVQRKK